jgi:hypothetical protein
MGNLEMIGCLADRCRNPMLGLRPPGPLFEIKIFMFEIG